MGFESPFLVLNMIGKCCLPTPIHILRPLFSSPFSMQSLFLLDKIPANLITLSGWLRRRQQVEDESYAINSSWQDNVYIVMQMIIVQELLS